MISFLTGELRNIHKESSTIELDVAGVTSTTDLFVDSNLSVGGISTVSGNIDVQNLSTFSNGVDINGDLDVDGHTNLDNVSISGVVTATEYYGDGSTLSGIAVTNYVHTNTLQVNGISTFSGSVIDIHGQVGAAKSVLTSTGAGVSWGSAAAKVTISPSQPATAEEVA